MTKFIQLKPSWRLAAKAMGPTRADESLNEHGNNGRDQLTRAVRCECYVICLSHIGNAFRFRYTTGVGNIGLNYIYAAYFRG